MIPFAGKFGIRQPSFTTGIPVKKERFNLLLIKIFNFDNGITSFLTNL